MNYLNRVITPLILVALIFLFSLTPVNAAEVDDSTVFVDAFNAYQQKDYLLAIEKCDQLNQVFPESPLRDVTLLLISRASLKSGDNERAAKSAATFLSEFPDSTLKTSVEDELKVLVSRQQNNEVLVPEKTLQAAAGKVRSDRLAREREAELKREMARLAKIKSEQERLARIKLETERRENERLLAEKLAKASIKAAIRFNVANGVFPVGADAHIIVEITNSGKNEEDFLVTAASDKEYNATLTKNNKPGEDISRLKLAAGETFKGNVTFSMPDGLVDGHRSVVTVKAVSANYSDVSFQNETTIAASAPLVRAVAKLAKQKVVPGENLRYRVTVINAGSMPTQELTVRLQLPAQVVFQGIQDHKFIQEPDGTLVFNVGQVAVGQLAEINMDVKIREGSAIGQELRGQVEVINGNLKRKDIFRSTASYVQAKL